MSKNGIIHELNTVVARTIVNQMAACNSTSITNQDNEVSCQPNTRALTENGVVLDAYESNAACTRGMEMIRRGMEYQFGSSDTVGTEERMWHGSNARVRMPIDDQMLGLFNRYQDVGIGLCKACSMTDVTQSSMISSDANCYSVDNFQESFRGELASQINAQLVMSQGVLNGLMKALNKPGVTQVSEDISSKISTHITQNFVESLSTELSNQQVITVSSQSSIHVNRMTEHSVLTVVMKKVTEVDLANKILDDEQWSIVQREVIDQDTLGDLGEAVFRSTIKFAHTIDHTVGMVLIGVVAIMGLAVFILIGHNFYTIIQRQRLKAAHLTKIKELHVQETKGA